MFRYIIYTCHHLTFPVALAAKERDVCFIGTRVGISIVEDVMVPVTLIAAGGIRIVHQ
jgi:hypothetical protein